MEQRLTDSMNGVIIIMLDIQHNIALKYMKIKNEHRHKLMDFDFDPFDFIVFEDNDFDLLNAYFSRRTNEWTYTKDEEYLSIMLNQVYFDYRGYKTKFARMQHDKIMQDQFGKISPVLKYVYAELLPVRDRVRKYHDKLKRELPFRTDLMK